MKGKVPRVKGECGDVVASLDPESVWMTSGSGKTEVHVAIPVSAGINGLLIDTDFETARRMVEGAVKVLVVVSDGKVGR